MDQISNPKKSYPYFASLLRMHVPTRVPHHDRPPSRPGVSTDTIEPVDAPLVACFSPRTEPRGVLGSPAM